MFYAKDGTVMIYFTEKGDISEFPTEFFFEVKEELGYGEHQAYQKKVNENLVYKGKEVRIRGEIVDAEKVLLKSAVLCVGLLDDKGKPIKLTREEFLRDLDKFKVGILQKLVVRVKDQYGLNIEEEDKGDSEEKNSEK